MQNISVNNCDPDLGRIELLRAIGLKYEITVLHVPYWEMLYTDDCIIVKMKTLNSGDVSIKNLVFNLNGRLKDNVFYVESIEPTEKTLAKLLQFKF